MRKTPAAFRSMGCVVVVAGADPARAHVLFERYDATFSRFRAGGELNRVNAHACPPVRVSPLFARVLTRALQLAAATEGLVDPLAAAGAFALVLALVRGPFRHDPHAWNAASFTESLRGRILQSGVATEAIVSTYGSADGRQRLLVRADLLDGQTGLAATSLQLEYLPSGVVCRGQVTAVGSTSFAGLCRLPSGETRSIDASWELLDDGTVSGTIRSARA